MDSQNEEENISSSMKNLLFSKKMSKQQKRNVEIIVLLLTLVVLWGLFSLPIVLYYTDSSPTKEESHGTSSSNKTDCSNKYEYVGQHCLEYLQSFSQCIFNNEMATVFIGISPEEQMILEDRMTNLLLGLDIIDTSKECKREVYPFLCLYVFGLCGQNDINYQPTSAECSGIRDSVCELEWKRAEEILASSNFPQLPDCSSFSGEGGLDCNLENDSMWSETSSNSSNELECNITCDANFYCENDICRPRCDEFMQFSDSYVKLSDSLLIISGFVGLLCSIAVLFAYWHRRKTLMTFPSILVFYMTISLLFVELIVLISFTNRAVLFCSSKDLVESILSPTLFCQISGFIETYAILHCTMWWLLNIGALFWKIQFPFHSRYYDSTRRTQYIHLGCVIVAIVLPVYAPISIAAKSGFVIPRFPPIVCLPRNAEENFYALIAPISILFAAGTTLLLLILRKIRQHIGDQSRRNALFSPAERKVFVVFLYYLFSGVLQLTTFSIVIKEIDRNREALLDYFTCKSTGGDDSCSSNIEHTEFWSLFATIILLLFPIINLYFSVNFNRSFLLKCCCCGRRSQSQSGTHSTFATTPKQTTEI